MRNRDNFKQTAVKLELLPGRYHIILHHRIIFSWQFGEIRPDLPVEDVLPKRVDRLGLLGCASTLVVAVALLVINLFTRKVYCRYICPLGAALSISSKVRLFDWLKRRKECGNPCQVCANECEVQAIHPDGHINHNECHYCLDCQVTYWDDHQCPPLSEKRVRKEKSRAALQQIRQAEKMSENNRSATGGG